MTGIGETVPLIYEVLGYNPEDLRPNFTGRVDTPGSGSWVEGLVSLVRE